MSTESLKFAKFNRSTGGSFAHPAEVLDDATLSPEEKRSVLDDWKASLGGVETDEAYHRHHYELDDAIAKLAALRT